MSESKVEQRDAILVVSLNAARSTDPTVYTEVGVVFGRWTKEDLERQGLVPLAKHPSPVFPGQMKVSDPAVDRESEAIERRKEERVKANQERFKRSVKAAGKTGS